MNLKPLSTARMIVINICGLVTETLKKSLLNRKFKEKL